MKAAVRTSVVLITVLLVIHGYAYYMTNNLMILFLPKLFNRL